MTSDWPSSVRPPRRRSRRGARPRPLDPRSQDHGTFSRCSGIERRRSRSRMRRPSWLMSSATPSATRKTADWSDPGRERQVVLGRLGLGDLLDLAVFGLAGRPATSHHDQDLWVGSLPPCTVVVSFVSVADMSQRIHDHGPRSYQHSSSWTFGTPHLLSTAAPSAPAVPGRRPHCPRRPQPTGWNAAPAAPLAPEPAPP